MLFIERQLASAVCLGCATRVKSAGAASKVDDLGSGSEIHTPAPSAHGRAKVDVFAIHEISLIEQARGFGVAAPNEQARGAHPVDQPLLTGHGGNSAPAGELHQRLLPKFAERGNHRSERQLRIPVCIDKSRSDN